MSNTNCYEFRIIFLQCLGYAAYFALKIQKTDSLGWELMLKSNACVFSARAGTKSIPGLARKHPEFTQVELKCPHT